MARLYNAIDGSHFFIRPGPSQGTLQIYPEGIAWLKRNYTLPDRGEDVYLDFEAIHKLKHKGYLYLRGEQYDHSNRDTEFEFEQRFAMFFGGLPLLLRQKEPSWKLYLDLTELGTEVWEELHSHRADMVTTQNAAPISWRQLIYAHNGLLQVYPFAYPYQIFSQKNTSKRRLEQAPATPGLNDKWQGNVFIERATQANTWQRRLPGSSVTFSGILLWLAKQGCELDWPGQSMQVSNITAGWQLWRLTVDEAAPITWDAIKNWFKERDIDVVPLHQHLEIVSPPLAITDDGKYVVEPGRAQWIACYPLRGLAAGVVREISLSAGQISSNDNLNVHLSNSISASRSANRISYFRWCAEQAGDYRIRVQGDASAEPLLVRVGTQPFKHPGWLRELSCTVKLDEEAFTRYAFNDSADVQIEPFVIDKFPRQKLAVLSWIYEPEGLPLIVSWSYNAGEKVERHSNFCRIQSNDELTRCWQEKICSVLTGAIQVRVTLDAGSFGSIDLVLQLPVEPLEPVPALLIDEWLIAQFSWLSYVIDEKRTGHTRVPVPANLRERLRNLEAQTGNETMLHHALEKLMAVHAMPEWISYRLRMLLAEVENQESGLKTDIAQLRRKSW